MADSPRAQAVLNSAHTDYPRLEDQIEWYDRKRCITNDGTAS